MLGPVAQRHTEHRLDAKQAGALHPAQPFVVGGEHRMAFARGANDAAGKGAHVVDAALLEVAGGLDIPVAGFVAQQD